MAKTPEEVRAKLLKKIARMTPTEFRKKLQSSKFVAKLNANGIRTT